jgi:hypothetical protein
MRDWPYPVSEQKSSKRPAFPLILTGNDLLAGHVIYFDGEGWTSAAGAAAVARDEQSASVLEAVLEASPFVVEPYLVTAGADTGGRPQPIHYREKIRLIGPTYALEGAANVPL